MLSPQAPTAAAGTARAKNDYESGAGIWTVEFDRFAHALTLDTLDHTPPAQGERPQALQHKQVVKEHGSYIYIYISVCVCMHL